jgi:hypothetical protein
VVLALVLVGAGLLFSSCAHPGLLAERYDESFYRIPRQLPDTVQGDSTSFLVFGDTQASWRAEVKFYRRSNWATWKQALFPFYQLYLVGNGLVGGINYLRQKPDYGAKARAAVRQALRRAARSTDTRFLLHLGDLNAHDGRYPAHWARFLREYRHGDEALLHTYPLLPVIGNHETANDSTYGWPNYEAVFDYGRFYTVDLPHAALFVLDSNVLVDHNRDLDDATQERLFQRYFVGTEASGPSWLERQLEARADRPFKIVALHHPLLTVHKHESNWRSAANGPELLAKRKKLLRLLQRHGVQVILSGHEHIYAHNVLRGGCAPDVHQIVSSGAGAAVRPPVSQETRAERLERYRRQGLAVETVRQRSAYHYTRASVTAERLVFETYAVSRSAPRDTALIERIVFPNRSSPEAQASFQRPLSPKGDRTQPPEPQGPAWAASSCRPDLGPAR